MIQGLGPYPAYRDSGTRFLDPLPDHWKAVPLGRLGRFHRGIGGTKDDDVPEGVPVIRYGDLYTKYEGFITRSARFVNADRAADYAPIRRGDVLFAASGETIEEIGKSAVNLIDAEARCGGDVLIFRPSRGLLSRFLGYATNASYAVHQKATMGRGFTVVHIYANELRNLVLAVPTADEQATIVRFLDYVDRRIGRYVRAKQSLIKLLDEQKQAIIHRAVTRGPDPNVRLKPSGVEWLVELPEHWDARRIRACLTDTRAGIWGDDPTTENASDHVVCLRVADFDMRRLRVSANKLTVRAVPAAAREPRRLIPGDILMEKSGGGEAEPVGRVVLYDGQVAPHAITSNFIVRLRPDAALIAPEFLLLVLATMQSTRRNVQWIKQTTGIQNLDERAYLSLAIGVPPTAEQQGILFQLKSMLRTVDQSIERSVQEISLLREYRTRLIADLVTGKVDVREATARLPDDDEESAALEEVNALVDAGEETADDLDAIPEEATA